MATEKRLYRDLEREVMRVAAVVAAAKEADLDDVGSWVFWDTKAPGLRVHFGRHKITFSFFKQHRVHGKRSTTAITLGHYPEMSVVEARKAAMIEGGRVAAGRIRPGQREAVRFDAAFNEYLLHLESKAKRLGKEPQWRNRVVSLGKMLLPEFGRWPLADLSHNPAMVRDWHRKATQDNGPVVANRAAQVLRACYRHAAKLNRSLPPALPTSAVVMNVEAPAEKGVLDFREWAKAWRAIPSPVRRSFTLACLLTGARRGELARLEWRDVKPRERVLVLRKTKGRAKDIELPLSQPIIRALKLARTDDVKVFPGAGHNPVRDHLPAYGHALRHAFASTAQAIGIDPLLLKLLMGHSLGSDVTEGYLSRGMLRAPLRDAQRRISTEIVRRLGIKL